MKKSSCLLLLYTILASGYALADRVESVAELRKLPPICKGAQQVRDISHDPIPLEKYKSIYGFDYSHFHHYCWALNSENKAPFDHEHGQSKLSYAIGDLDYVIRNSNPSFILLPEVYNAKGRILFKLDRDPEAVASLTKALQLKPDHFPAALQLSGYYERIGDKNTAIEILKRSISKSQKPPASVVRRLEKLTASSSATPSSPHK